jgi:hypothetical protein
LLSPLQVQKCIFTTEYKLLSQALSQHWEGKANLPEFKASLNYIASPFLKTRMHLLLRGSEAGLFPPLANPRILERAVQKMGLVPLRRQMGPFPLCLFTLGSSEPLLPHNMGRVRYRGDIHWRCDSVSCIR